MMTVTAITLLTYAMAFVRGMSFFLRHEACRETDKHIVGALMAGGVLFMLFQLIMWFEHPAELFKLPILSSIWMAFNFFNAALYLTLAHLFTRNRKDHSPHKGAWK